MCSVAANVGVHQGCHTADTHIISAHIIEQTHFAVRFLMHPYMFNVFMFSPDVFTLSQFLYLLSKETIFISAVYFIIIFT